MNSMLIVQLCLTNFYYQFVFLEKNSISNQDATFSPNKTAKKE